MTQHEVIRMARDAASLELLKQLVVYLMTSKCNRCLWFVTLEEKIVLDSFRLSAYNRALAK